MRYHGKLYGKLWDKYFDTSHDTDEWDAMERQISELKAENEALRQSGTTDGTDGVSFVSNLDRAIMCLEADQSLNESVDLKRDKLIEAKNIVADILAHSR